MFPKNISGSIACVSLGCLLVCSGGILAIFWPAIFKEIVASCVVASDCQGSTEKSPRARFLESQRNYIPTKTCVIKSMQLRPESTSFIFWRDTPVTMYIDFYFFNWTNPEDITKEGVKPNLQEIGPYRFIEVKEKKDIVWNDNKTISFMQERRWYFDPENSNGSLSDNLTTINVVALTAAYVSRNWAYLYVWPLSKILNGQTISITHTIGEFLFDGFDNPLIQFGKFGSIFNKDMKVPFDKFGWYYNRNGSKEFEGQFNIGTGEDDISQIGSVHQWKYANRTDNYPNTCGEVKGSAGEMFPLFREKNGAIQTFSPDTCSSWEFEYTDEINVDEINGYRYTGGLSNVDNGTKYPANSCYCGGECVPSGIVNVSSCHFGSPAFFSYPHFYKADPYYLDQVDGLSPDENKHRVFFVVEPTTGIPLDVAVRVQINILMQSYKKFPVFANLPKVFFPMVWFEQRATVSFELASIIKKLLLLSPLGIAAAVVLITVGITCMLTALVKRYKEQCKEAQKQGEKVGDSEVVTPLMVLTKEPRMVDSVYFVTKIREQD